MLKEISPSVLFYIFPLNLLFLKYLVSSARPPPPAQNFFLCCSRARPWCVDCFSAMFLLFEVESSSSVWSFRNMFYLAAPKYECLSFCRKLDRIIFRLRGGNFLCDTIPYIVRPVDCSTLSGEIFFFLRYLGIGNTEGRKSKWEFLRMKNITL